MDLQSYFNPLTTGFYSNKDRWETTQIGRNIEMHTEDFFPDLKFTEIAIFNISEYDGSKNSGSESDCPIKASFYSLYYSDLPKIADLGSMKLMPNRKESFKVIQEVCRELIHNGVIPFVIGGGHDVSYAIYKAYVLLDKFCLLYTSPSPRDS